MDLARVFVQLWAHRGWLVLVAVVSVVLAVLLNYQVSLVPPRVSNPKIQLAAASTEILIDAPGSVVGDVEPLVEPLAQRAQVFAEFLETDGVREAIARYSGVPARSFVIEGQRGEAGVTSTTEIRASELFVDSVSRRVFFRSERHSPIIAVFTQAPDADVALRLADGASRGVQAFVERLQRESRVPPGSRVRVVRLGEAQGGYVNRGVDRVVVVLMAVGFFVAGCFVVLLCARVGRALGEAREEVKQQKRVQSAS